jgi:hypothetical protein
MGVKVIAKVRSVEFVINIKFAVFFVIGAFRIGENSIDADDCPALRTAPVFSFDRAFAYFDIAVWTDVPIFVLLIMLYFRINTILDLQAVLY